LVKKIQTCTARVLLTGADTGFIVIFKKEISKKKGENTLVRVQTLCKRVVNMI